MFVFAPCRLQYVAARHEQLPAKIGLRSKQAELRNKVKADKFPTAKEAGLQKSPKRAFRHKQVFGLLAGE